MVSMVTSWKHFNARNDCNDVFLQYGLPQMDVYTCYFESELVYHTSVKLLVLDNMCSGGPPTVVVQTAEQNNGLYDSATLEQFRATCKGCEGWGELLAIVETKLKELNISQ